METPAEIPPMGYAHGHRCAFKRTPAALGSRSLSGQACSVLAGKGVAMLFEVSEELRKRIPMNGRDLLEGAFGAETELVSGDAHGLAVEAGPRRGFWMNWCRPGANGYSLDCR